MASKELSSALRRLISRDVRFTNTPLSRNSRRYTSTDAARVNEDFHELESHSSFLSNETLDEKVKSYDPKKRVAGRRRELPPSRYQFRPPRYYRGPLHPHQPPPKSDPSSREFVPGPFYYTRLEQTYQAMIAPDLMTLGYVHQPPGTVKVPKADRLRTWDDSSPYHKGRPKRGPRGPGDQLRLVEKDINWRTIPKIDEVTVHTMVKGAIDDSSHLHVAGIMLQSITGIKPKVHRARRSVSQFGIRADMAVSLTCTMRGEQAYEFVDKCVNLVFPRIKDWPGVNGSAGDNSGNITWGFSRDGAIMFPEVEVNYDMYPPKLIPGFHVTVKTTATSDRHARLLLSAMGIPFHGEFVD
ncbi:hypothetical protein B2J93_2443 [Marssonina coronariae]|uniref:Large ribosomal subunit protein uL5m n=1 Tax=Diplocarpon coronariae TaxID=2795749 RepID=A0A218YYZ3_9HELO|nr:mitochondrial 54S ribosomal protein YmL7/YmL5 [Diplocarpon mali]OWP00226.1 hypothetical protein B2J93_2443 [Marssonina coronariae]